jgi:hypothetical protein
MWICVSRLMLEELLENGQKTASQLRAVKCFCGTRQSTNHASLFPCASGIPGESAWPGQTNAALPQSLQWSQSRLLFPGPNGAPMSRAALHNALRPCACNRLRRKRTSPLRCCRRLILRLSYPARMGCCFCTRSDGRKTQANTRPFGNRGQNPALDRPKIGVLNAVHTDLNCQSRAEARAIRRLATTSPSCLPRSHASSNSSNMTS